MSHSDPIDRELSIMRRHERAEPTYPRRVIVTIHAASEFGGCIEVEREATALRPPRSYDVGRYGHAHIWQTVQRVHIDGERAPRMISAERVRPAVTS